MKKSLALFLVLLVTGVAIIATLNRNHLSVLFGGSSADIAEVEHRVRPDLSSRLASAGLELGARSFIRVFKEEHHLEVWMQAEDTFVLFDTYEICNFSGDLGPKLREGDRQSPEGFYAVDSSAMNPNSSYHLSFNLGFPNQYDRAHDRTGSFLMIHGDCVSVGCYAMTDEGIEEIYLIVDAAHRAGQSHVPVHAFPFRMSQDRLAREQGSQWYPYWRNLKTGYDLFELNKVPPKVSVREKQYVFDAI